jgi:DNA-binding ferritin-like protein (Dps family)
MDDDEVPMDKLAKIYQKIRARVQALTTEYETQLDELKAQQQEVANEMKNRMQKLGMASVRTTEGTIVLGQKTRYFTSDWDSFKQFVLEHEVLDLFEKRIAQGNMKQFMEENPGVVVSASPSRAVCFV